MLPQSILLSLLLMLGTGVVGWYFYSKRSQLGCMDCMMGGMVFGGVAGLAVATIYAIDTSDFIGAAIFGTIAGLAVGVPLGLIGGVMGRMEAVMWAPMGALMGAMLGVMVRFYTSSLKLFVPFFVAVILVMLGEMAYYTFKKVNQRRPAQMEVAFAGMMLVGMVFASTFLAVPVGAQGSAPLQLAVGAQAVVQPNEVQLPPPAPEVQAPAAPSGGGPQEATIRLEQFGYEPNFLTLKSGVPTKLNLEASNSAGCTRAFAIRKLGVRKTVDRGGRDVVELAPQPPGVLQFSCSMGMAGGSIKFV